MPSFNCLCAVKLLVHKFKKMGDGGGGGGGGGGEEEGIACPLSYCVLPSKFMLPVFLHWLASNCSPDNINL